MERNVTNHKGIVNIQCTRSTLDKIMQLCHALLLCPPFSLINEEQSSKKTTG